MQQYLKWHAEGAAAAATQQYSTRGPDSLEGRRGSVTKGEEGGRGT